MMSKIAIDTNILIYLHEETHTFKKEKANEIITNFPAVSTQVISEYINVLERLIKAPKLRLIEHSIALLDFCEIITFNKEILEQSKKLIIRYDFQLFDSIIIASALEANCSILYSEDLQHNQLIEKRLTIINPFL